MDRRSLAFGFAAILAIAQFGTAVAGGAPPQAQAASIAAAKIDKGLTKELQAKGTTRFIVQFAAKADLGPAAKEKTHAKKAKAVFDALTKTARTSQGGALEI